MRLQPANLRRYLRLTAAGCSAIVLRYCCFKCLNGQLIPVPRRLLTRGSTPLADRLEGRAQKCAAVYDNDMRNTKSLKRKELI